MKLKVIKFILALAFIAALFSSCKTPCHCGLGQVEPENVITNEQQS